jgi:anti-sigma regulatory factor (Ser/Thr protein kinase)
MINVVVEDASDLAQMRLRVGDFALRAGDSASDVILAANELATNSLTYTGGPCRVIGTYPSNCVMRIAVADRGGYIFHFPAGPACASSIGGRGLMIVRAVGSRCGITIAPHSTCVWFEMDLPVCPN